MKNILGQKRCVLLPLARLLPFASSAGVTFVHKYEQLSGMSQRYSSVFLKPVTGSFGKGIIRVSERKDGIICQYTSVNGSVTRKSYSSLKQSVPPIKNKVRGKRYLIQQGLTLLKIQTDR